MSSTTWLTRCPLCIPVADVTAVQEPAFQRWRLNELPCLTTLSQLSQFGSSNLLGSLASCFSNGRPCLEIPRSSETGRSSFLSWVTSFRLLKTSDSPSLSRADPTFTAYSLPVSLCFTSRDSLI